MRRGCGGRSGGPSRRDHELGLLAAAPAHLRRCGTEKMAQEHAGARLAGHVCILQARRQGQGAADDGEASGIGREVGAGEGQPESSCSAQRTHESYGSYGLGYTTQTVGKGPYTTSISPANLGDLSMRPLSFVVTVLFLFSAAPLRADEPPEIPLWEKGPPGFESRKDEKDVREVQKSGEYKVTNVHNPTLS